MNYSNQSLFIATAGGTVVSVAPRLIVTSEITKTVLLGTIGALVSFSVSLVLRYLLRRFNRH